MMSREGALKPNPHMQKNQPSLFQENRTALSLRWPSLADQVLAASRVVNLVPRDDGYLTAHCIRDGGDYVISDQSDIAADLYTFRTEIKKNLQNGVELFFLLGIGLGEKLCALWHELDSASQGLVVVLEESPALLRAACECADLRQVCTSPRCEFIVDTLLETKAIQAIKEHSWFGARQSLFFWGYQAHDHACQPPYRQLAQSLTEQIKLLQQSFLQNWQDWLQRPAWNPRKIALLYPVGTRNNARLQTRNPMADADIIEIAIPSSGFVPPTYLRQKILQSNMDVLVWCNTTPQTWLSAEEITQIGTRIRLLD
jgi:hypothetical protein